MKRLTHTEWQLLAKEEEYLLKEHLKLVTSGHHEESRYDKQMKEIARLKKGESTCLDCTLGRNLPH